MPDGKLEHGGNAGLELQRLQVQYLRLQIEVLRAANEDRIAARGKDRAAEEKAATQAAVERELGRSLSRLIVLSGYALVLGAVSSPTLIATLADPQTLAQNLKTASHAVSAAANAVPGFLSSLIGAGLTTLIVLAFQSTSMSVRRDVGGMVVGGIEAVAVLGFAAAMTAGPLWTVAAVLGLVGATYVLYMFLEMLQGLSVVTTSDSDGQAWLHGRLVTRINRHLDSLIQHVAPTSNRWAGFTFVILAPVSVAVVGATIALYMQGVRGEPHVYWLSWGAQRAFLLWCLWAYVVTPRVIRIALWSIVGWSGLLLALLLLTPVSIAFAIAMSAILGINVMIFTLRGPQSSERWLPGPGRQREAFADR